MSDKQGWTDGPNTRGTFDIFWLCFSTLALCVWTAVHPNILLRPSTKSSLLTRIGMMAVAIVFPEVIISSAWRQLRSSQRLRTEINRLNITKTEDSSQIDAVDSCDGSAANDHASQRALLPSFQFEVEGTTTSPIRREPVATRQEPITQISSREDVADIKPYQWSSQQAFFAVMGGFAIENDYLAESGKRVTIRKILTVEGVLQLAKLDLLPEIGPDDISERSKADNIAKVFVLSQITWFGLQVIGRLASQLAVTPIELHTVIHVACAMIMYLLWMEKPYDVRTSVLISNSDAKAVAALFNFYKISSSLHIKAWAQFEAARIRYWKDRVVRAANNLLDYDPPPVQPVKEELSKAVKRYSMGFEAPAPAFVDPGEHILVALAPLAERGLNILETRGGYSEVSINTQDWALLRENSENFVMKAVWGGWSTNTGHEMSLDKGVHFLFNFLYGGGHLSAWASSAFPTETERVLWISSAFMLACIPLFGSMWILWWRAVNSKRRWLYPIRNGNLDIIVAPFFFMLMIFYFLARFYFLVESLVSLRLLPEGAYSTVNWARYLPHIA